MPNENFGKISFQRIRTFIYVEHISNNYENENADQNDLLAIFVLARNIHHCIYVIWIFLKLKIIFPCVSA